MGYDLVMPLRLLSLAIVVFSTISISAQSTRADIETRLLHQPLYLRGQWRDDSLKFAADGALRNKSLPVSFTLAGVDITRVQLKPDRLLLEGRRVGLTFKNNAPQRVPLNSGDPNRHVDESMFIEITAPASTDYTAVLDSIFSDFPTLLRRQPLYWQKYATTYLTPSAAATSAVTAAATPVRRVGGGVTPPKVLKAPEPEFSGPARALKQGGNCLVYLQINTNGEPTNVAVLKPVGLGMDERAMAAVMQYKFNPATENGHPVVVEINVEVSFQIF